MCSSSSISSKNKTLAGYSLFSKTDKIWFKLKVYNYLQSKQLLIFAKQIQPICFTPRRAPGITFWNPMWPRELKMKRKPRRICWTAPSSMRACSDWVTLRHVVVLFCSFACETEHSGRLIEIDREIELLLLDSLDIGDHLNLELFRWQSEAATRDVVLSRRHVC